MLTYLTPGKRIYNARKLEPVERENFNEKYICQLLTNGSNSNTPFEIGFIKVLIFQTMLKSVTDISKIMSYLYIFQLFTRLKY